jgi:hypothetical protein
LEGGVGEEIGVPVEEVEEVVVAAAQEHGVGQIGVFALDVAQSGTCGLGSSPGP